MCQEARNRKRGVQGVGYAKELGVEVGESRGWGIPRS